MSLKNSGYQFRSAKEVSNSYLHEESRRVIEGRVREWGDWDFSLNLPGFTVEQAESFAGRMVALLEASEPSLSTMFKESPEQHIWEKALKRAIAKELNPRRVFVHQTTTQRYELRYTRYPSSKLLAANLHTITSAITKGSILSFVYPGTSAGVLESTRFVKPLAIELNEIGQVYVRARRLSAGREVTRNYLVARGHSYVEQSIPTLEASWLIQFNRSGSSIRAELTPIA